MSIHPEGQSPIFGECVTKVILDDESGGPFIVIDQSVLDGAENGKVRLELEELREVMAVAEYLLAQPGAVET